MNNFLNKLAPDFSLPDQAGTLRTLKKHRGSWVLLYFYPKDNTPGCTTEACSLRDNFAQFKKAGITVLGVSTDSPASHQKFASKFSLPFTLLADEEKEVVKKYGVWGEKKFMGRTFMGTRRMSFLIDPSGMVVKVYETVKPAEHAEEVLQDVVFLSRA